MQLITRVLKRVLKLGLFLTGISYPVHIVVTRAPYIAIHPEGYMAMVTPHCWSWSVISLAAMIAFGYLYGVRELNKLRKELEAVMEAE